MTPETYTKRTAVHLAQYHNAPWYDYDAIPKTLTKLLAPTATELTHLPVLRDLISIKADKADMDTETALGFGEQAMQKMAERREEQRLLNLFTHCPLSTNFSPADSIEGFLNFNNTCFAAVSTWQILVSSYIHLISPSSHPQAIECPPEDVNTEQDEGYISLTSGEKATPLNSLSPEECLTLVKKESDRDTKTVLLTAATRKCLVTMESQYRKKQYPEMQNTYERFLTLCTACASDDIFVGFEDFHERYIEFISSQLLEKEAEGKKTGNKQSTEEPDQEDKLPVFPLKYLPQQDSAEFLASLLKLVLPREQLNKCAFRLLTERMVMRGPDILTITDDPRTTPANTPEVSPIKDSVNPDTLIYSVPVSLEQTERHNFSIQMILDDALSLKNITEGAPQKITLTPNNFRYAIRNFPSSLSRAKETGMSNQLWDVLQERQVLLVEDAPEVITIQPKMVHELCDRAKIAEKLAHDDTKEFQLTFRKCSPDAERPLEDITQKYRIVAKVFYVEEGEARTRHYRCLINGRERLPDSDEHKVVDSIVMDDKNVFIAPPNHEHLIQLGILCMFTAEKIPSPTSRMEKAYAFTPIKTDNHNI
ncbi:hypothetical protein [Endozoicomonas atrinae]|uniref:hypothetical protein n=1 Tax=Endozoicomonas atrinae TaxID=1333660 RepID=UPI003AFFD571